MFKHAVIPLLVGASLLASAPFAQAATNLVYCSEGSPELPQTRFELRRQPVQHLAAGRGLGHRLGRTFGLGMDHFHPPTHRISPLRLMLGGLLAQAAEALTVSSTSTLSRLAALPANTAVYCTHEYTLSNLRFAQAVEPANADIAAQTGKDSTGRVVVEGVPLVSFFFNRCFINP